MVKIRLGCDVNWDGWKERWVGFRWRGGEARKSNNNSRDLAPGHIRIRIGVTPARR